jgi:hypothetical protein
MTREGFKSGDSYLIDDITGLKIRRSDAVKKWDGAIVHQGETNPRHPQDFVRAKSDRQLADVVRPRSIDVFGGPLQTTLATAALIQATGLHLVSAVRMLVGDRIQVMLDSGEVFDTYITEILDTEHINVSPALKRAANLGASVVNLTATSEPKL